MSNGRQTALLLLMAAVAGIAGILYYYARSNVTASERATQALKLATLVDLGGKPQSLSQWDGKVLVVNFWATWCAPCREEIPALIKTQKKYANKSVQFVGIGIDNASKIRDYAAEMKIDYPLFIGGIGVLDMTGELGNRAGVLPFTVVLDRNGKLAYAHAGAMTEAGFDAVLAPLL